jgi:hypothetical protein
MLMNRLVTTLALAGLAFGPCVFADAAGDMLEQPATDAPHN